MHPSNSLIDYENYAITREELGENVTCYFYQKCRSTFFFTNIYEFIVYTCGQEHILFVLTISARARRRF